jgi:ribosomal protein S27AE
MPHMAESETATAKTIDTRVCSRCGLSVAKMANGKLRHAAGRWSSKSCGQPPDPIPYIDWLEAHPWQVWR